MRLNEISFSRGSRPPKRRVGRGAGSDLVRLRERSEGSEGTLRRRRSSRIRGRAITLANAYSKIWIPFK